MKLPKFLIAGAGILMVGVAPLLQAAPGPGGPDDHDRDRGNGGPRQEQRHDDHRGGGRPPQDFGPVRKVVVDHRESFGRYKPLPPNVRIERGHRVPRGYGHPLPPGALGHLPQYPGYQWQRVGPDLVLVAIGTGLVYEILSGALGY